MSDEKKDYWLGPDNVLYPIREGSFHITWARGYLNSKDPKRTETPTDRNAYEEMYNRGFVKVKYQRGAESRGYKDGYYFTYGEHRPITQKQLYILKELARETRSLLFDDTANKEISLLEESFSNKGQYLYTHMNYRDFFKNKKVTSEDIQRLIPEGVSHKEFDMGIKNECRQSGGCTCESERFAAAKIVSENLKQDKNYYTKINESYDEEDGCGCEDDGRDDNGGLPLLGGALDVGHYGQPISIGKIVQTGPAGMGGNGLPATGELSGMTNVSSKKGVATDVNLLSVGPDGDKEPITAGGKPVESDIASRSAGGPIASGGGQRQGGINSKGTIANTTPLNEGKKKLRNMVKEVLKEIKFDRAIGKWVRIDESKHKAGCKCAFCMNKGKFGGKKKDGKKDEEVNENRMDTNMADMKMGASYKVVQPVQYKTVEDMLCRKNQYDPEITEMYDDEEECMMNERYVALANAQRNLTESELTELKSLREKIDSIAEKKDKWIQKAIKHPGRCTPMSKPGCTGHARALAKRFKSGDLSEETDNTTVCPNCSTGHIKQHGYNEFECLDCGKRFNNLKEPRDQHGNTGSDRRALSRQGIVGPDLEEDNSRMNMKLNSNDLKDLEEHRCEDYPCCGHEDGDCPDSQGRFTCVGCGKRLSKDAPSSICPKCQRRMGQLDREDPTGQDFENEFGGEMEENTVNMKMGPSYKKVQPRLYKTSEDDFARTNEYDPEISEAGGQSVQHSSYRTVGNDHGNLPQSGKQRWSDDVDESKKPSDVFKKIQKGMKSKKSQKNSHLKFQPAKKTSTGVHKRK